MQLSSIGIIFAVLSTTLSSIAIIFQASVAKVFPFAFLASASNIIGALLVGLSIVSKKKSLDLIKIKPEVFNILILAILRSFIGSLLFWWALGHTQAIKAMFFTKAEPYFILAWNWILDRRPTKKQHLLLLCVHIIGAILLSTAGKFDLQTSNGDLMIILAVCVLGLSYRFGTKVSLAIGALQTSALSQLIGGCLLLPVVFFLGFDSIFEVEKIYWEQLFFAIILWNVFGLSFWLLALQQIPDWIVSALRALGPIIAAPFAYIFFGETLNIIQIIGAVLVLSTSLMITKDKK